MARRGQNEGSIYKRSDGRWAASITVGYEEGKRKRKTFYGETRKEVQEQLTAALRDHQQGLPLANDRLTVAQHLERWLTESKRPKLALSTYASYAAEIRLHIGPALGRFALSKLGPHEVQRYLNRELASGLSARTVQYHHAILRSALTQAVKWGLVPRNVAQLVESPRVRREEVRPLTPEEARHFLTAMRGDRLEALYTVALAIGLRRGEAVALRWDDVDLEAATVRVRRGLRRIEGKLQFLEVKSEHSRRTISLPRVVLATLRTHRVRQMEERLEAGDTWRDHGLVFPSRVGTPLEPRNVNRSFHRALKRAGLPPRRFHDTRHTCASLLLAQGVHPRVVMEILGHSRISVTMDIYSHVMPALQEEAADRMDTLLSGERQ